jgi:hypothetical protein
MKIWWQSSTPIHRLHDYRNTLTANLNSIKRADTEVHVNGVDEGSMDLHYNAIVAMNSFAPGGVLNKMMMMLSPSGAFSIRRCRRPAKC